MTEPDPIVRFNESFARAAQSEPFAAERVALATADAAGHPSVRFVLLKGADPRGFVFFTNFESRKGRELRDNPRAALAFHWSTTGEQVRVEGRVERVAAEEADAYFASRPRGSQLGAWASRQSQPIGSREELERRVAALDQQYAGRAVPRPEFWGGFRVVPSEIEFWHDRSDRLHDRALYRRTPSGWALTRLSP
ncbi:MAG: pyridoxamine 5'-phosphate oxidase [Myxococcales bacterium]